MVTLFWFILGLIIIIGVSRYNEDDKLFWKLLVAFVGSFAAVSVASHLVNADKQDKVVVIEKAPTQALESMSCNYCTLADISLTATKREKSPKPVGKDSLINQNSLILSEVHATMRGQPHWRMFFDDS